MLPEGGGGGAVGTFPEGKAWATGLAPGWDCCVDSVTVVILCGNDNFLLELGMSTLQCGHENLAALGALNNFVESSRFSKSVARCTNVSAVSQITSLTASFGSILSKCCNMFRNGISCGVSATCVKRKWTAKQTFVINWIRVFCECKGKYPTNHRRHWPAVISRRKHQDENLNLFHRVPASFVTRRILAARRTRPTERLGLAHYLLFVCDCHGENSGK